MSTVLRAASILVSTDADDPAAVEGARETLEGLRDGTGPGWDRDVRTAAVSARRELGDPDPGGSVRRILGEEDDARDGPRTMADLLEDPELLRPPEAVAPRFAWKGRVTLLAGREKRGKSTLGAACAGRVSRGARLMELECPRGPVLWVALEEHPSDLLRKLLAFDADPERVWILERLEHPLSDLRSAVEEVAPVLVVVDTLPALAALLEESPESGSAADWTPIMAALTRLARDFDAAVLLLHHQNKLGTFRDSTAIGAGVDVILELQEDPDHPGVRKVEARARWKVEPWSYRLEGDSMDPEGRPRLVVVEGGPTVREQVIAYVHDHPGASTREVRSAVTASAKAVGSAVGELLKEGVIVDLGDSATGRRLHPPDSTQGTALEPGQNRPRTASPAEVVPEGGSPPKGGAPRNRPPSGTSSGRTGNSCTCGRPIGPTAEICARCRKEARS